jgi:hypothetical protein
MARRAEALLAQIERDVLDESKPLKSALHQCVLLGGRTGLVDLRDWATRELRGYSAARMPSRITGTSGRPCSWTGSAAIFSSAGRQSATSTIDRILAATPSGAANVPPGGQNDH